MKLLAEEKENGSYIITVLVGRKGYNSLWTSPPKDKQCFDLDYIKNRYPIINTKERAKRFSSLYRNLWIKVSEIQLDLMRHCIGLNYKKKPYRNYFCTSPDDKDWNELVDKGLATKSEEEPNNGCIYFWLSRQGVEYTLGKSISVKVYSEL
ncbi:hypothetical protein GTH52_07180 [Clostridium tyrobutyricum]|uniref:Uncharacterized protein n=1 Tax=Clostridium tyrobutyricum DIVETGP TaxID=1408889 RepID=W6NHC9_CLOTY|nr:hypothetical protein [Clostridium tyrobutyricum]AND84248.1 hypothetical protein CTK_C09870 [Clostridium tyrobutyricum]AND84332.1 hypothetical protein CTK_C10710 [Clostridium tyrobutyricum]ANP68967.1 hypothetical protein BA182_04550 [Clostridium tyrobutyricum]MBR9648719.1 hypothetical protein [Clostridium tyrobutyricum]MBV4435484.1 hypothetical protein [Clostridium tyrobutyricum]